MAQRAQILNEKWFDDPAKDAKFNRMLEQLFRKVNGSISGTAITVEDEDFTLQDDGDNTKQGQFELSGVTTGTTRTLTWPDASGTIWTSGNDGAGSGLDADLLDGNSSAFFATAADLAAHISDSSAAHAASAIGFTPTGNLAATDVQAALAELDSEKQPLDADLTAIAALTTTTYGRSLLTLADEDALEALLDTLPNLVSVQGLTVTLADAGADAIFGWDDSAAAYENLTKAEAQAVLGLVATTTDNAIVRFDGTGGNTQNSGATIDDSGNVTANSFVGPLTGNASTATALQNARTIGGTSFDGTANIVPATITVADTTDASCNVALFESATGDLAPKTDAALTYAADTGLLKTTQMIVSTSGTLLALSNSVIPLFQLLGTTGGSASIGTGRFSNNVTPNSWNLSKSRGATIGSMTAVQVDDYTGTINFNGSDGTDFKPSVSLNGAVDATVSTGVLPGRWELWTTDAAGVHTLWTTVDCTGFMEHDGDADFSGDVTAATINGNTITTGTGTLAFGGGVLAGTYTPGLTNTTNVAASVAFVSRYFRIGDQVFVFGRVTIDPTAAANTVMGIDLPIASNLANIEELSGGAISPTITGQASASISGDVTNNRATLQFTATDTANRPFNFWFNYQII